MNRHYWYYRFLADVTWLDDFIDDIEDSAKALIVDMTDTPGVASGMVVTQRGAGQNFSVDVSSGSAYDVFGRRIAVAATTNVPFQDDANGDPIECVGGGNERIVSVYAYYHVTDSSPVVDGNGDTVSTVGTEDVEFKMYQGAIAGAGLGTPAANPNDGGVLLADVTITTGDATIANADIDTSVKDIWKIGGTADAIAVADDEDNFDGSDVEAVLEEIAHTLPPIGTILPFYDFNGALSFDTDHFKYCDGSVVTVEGIGAQTLPDMSNRYLVGFGTEGGGDIDTALWSATAVGNASHQVNVQHSHTVNAHTHDLGNHTHSVGNHTHDVDIGAFASAAGGTHSHTVNAHTHDLGNHTHTGGAHTHSISSDGTHDHDARTNGLSTTANEAAPDYRCNDAGTWFNANTDNKAISVENTAADAGEGGHDHNISSDGSHDHTGATGSAGAVATGTPSTNTSGSTSPGTDTVADHTHSINPPNTTSSTSAGTSGVPSSNTSGSTSPGTDSQLSAAFSIQPRSVRVRFIMRVA